MTIQHLQMEGETGLIVKVTMVKENYILLESDDGDLKMPDAFFQFEEEGGGNVKAGPKS